MMGVTKQTCWWFQQEADRVTKILADNEISNEVKFFTVGMFMRYCTAFACDIEQVLPLPPDAISVESA